MFNFTATSKVGGDCCQWFSVECDKTTVVDLIDFVLRQRSGEWGEIRIIPKNESWISCLYKLEYSKGKITKDDVPHDIKRKNILKLDANGGWSSMNYYVYLDIE